MKDKRMPLRLVYIATKQAYFMKNKPDTSINKTPTFAHMSFNKAICPHRMAADPAQKLITTTIIKTKNLHTKITMKIKQEIENLHQSSPNKYQSSPIKTINPYNCRKQQDKETYIKYQTSPNKNN